MTRRALTPQQLGVLFRNRPKQFGWNQTVLASKASLRQETVSVVEYGHPAMRLDTLLDLLATLGME